MSRVRRHAGRRFDRCRVPARTTVVVLAADAIVQLSAGAEAVAASRDGYEPRHREQR